MDVLEEGLAGCDGSATTASLKQSAMSVKMILAASQRVVYATSYSIQAVLGDDLKDSRTYVPLLSAAAYAMSGAGNKDRTPQQVAENVVDVSGILLEMGPNTEKAMPFAFYLRFATRKYGWHSTWAIYSNVAGVFSAISSGVVSASEVSRNTAGVIGDRVGKVVDSSVAVVNGATSHGVPRAKL